MNFLLSWINTTEVVIEDMIILDSKRPVVEGAPSAEVPVEVKKEEAPAEVPAETPVEANPAKLDEQVNPDDIPF